MIFKLTGHLTFHISRENKVGQQRSSSKNHNSLKLGQYSKGFVSVNHMVQTSLDSGTAKPQENPTLELLSYISGSSEHYDSLFSYDYLYYYCMPLNKICLHYFHCLYLLLYILIIHSIFVSTKVASVFYSFIRIEIKQATLNCLSTRNIPFKSIPATRITHQ